MWGTLLCLLLNPVAVETTQAAQVPARCDVPQRFFHARPDPKGVPTRVSVGIYVIDIAKVNDVEQSFTADIHLRLHWMDRRLVDGSLGASFADCKVGLDDVWNPRVRPLNRGVLVKQFEDMIEIAPDGGVTYDQRLNGNFSSPFDLREFPLDSHEFLITLVAAEYGPDEILFVVNKKTTGRAESFSITD